LGARVAICGRRLGYGSLPSMENAKRMEGDRVRRAGSATWWDLLATLTQSDLRYRYGRGPWRIVRWLLEPFALVGIFLLLITFVLDRPGVAPGLSLTCAIVPFQLLIASVSNAMVAVRVRRPILLNMAFERSLIPVSSVLTESAAFSASFVLFGLMMAIYAVPPTAALLWLPLVVAVTACFAAGLAYPACIFGIWFGELRPFALSFVRALFFLGPGLVPLAQAPESAQTVLKLNPLTGLFESYRDIFLYGEAPAAWQLVYPLAATAVLLAAFLPLYRREQTQFAKVVE
jgi:lipopolysaccharide transport system permease protein